MVVTGALRAKWFCYSVLCVLCWGAWVLCSKLGSNQIPASTMQFLFTFGFIPVALLALIVIPVSFEKSVKGISYSLANGILAGIGGLALFAAYGSWGEYLGYHHVYQGYELAQKDPKRVDMTDWAFAKRIVLLDVLLALKHGNYTGIPK